MFVDEFFIASPKMIRAFMKLAIKKHRGK